MIELAVRELASLSSTDEHVALVARVFPYEGRLNDRFHYDSAPSFVVEARDNGRLIGLRIVVDRQTQVAGASMRIAGMGIAVDPQHQRQGVGTALTNRALEEVKTRGFDIAVAFLLNKNAEMLLTRAGFRVLRSQVFYEDRQTGSRVTEEMATYARNIKERDSVAEIEREGALDLGIGTW